MYAYIPPNHFSRRRPVASVPAGARRSGAQTKNTKRTHFASTIYCYQCFTDGLRTHPDATNPTHFQPRPSASAGGLSVRAAGARHKSEGFAQMPVNRENPSVGNTPIRAPTVREGLRHTRLLHGGGNPSLTVGALMGVFPTLGFSRLTGIWANPSLLCRAPCYRLPLDGDFRIRLQFTRPACDRSLSPSWLRRLSRAVTWCGWRG